MSTTATIVIRNDDINNNALLVTISDESSPLYELWWSGELKQLYVVPSDSISLCYEGYIANNKAYRLWFQYPSSGIYQPEIGAPQFFNSFDPVTPLSEYSITSNNSTSYVHMLTAYNLGTNLGAITSIQSSYVQASSKETRIIIQYTTTTVA